LASRLGMLERLGPEGMARERTAAMLSPAASPEALAWVAWNTRRLHPAGYAQAARMLAHDALAHYAPRCTASVAVFSGTADGITRVEECRAAAAMFAKASYETIDGVGHALYIEQPARINQILTRLAHDAARAQEAQ